MIQKEFRLSSLGNRFFIFFNDIQYLVPRCAESTIYVVDKYYFLCRRFRAVYWFPLHRPRVSNESITQLLGGIAEGRGRHCDAKKNSRKDYSLPAVLSADLART